MCLFIYLIVTIDFVGTEGDIWVRSQRALHSQRVWAGVESSEEDRIRGGVFWIGRSNSIRFSVGLRIVVGLMATRGGPLLW